MTDRVGFCGTPCGHGPDDSFRCVQCGRQVCYCEGCDLSTDDDLLAESCNDCWVAETDRRAVVVGFDKWMDRLEGRID